MTRKAGFLFVAMIVTLSALAQTSAPAAAPEAPAAAAPTAAPAGGTKVGIINIQQAIVATNEGQRDFQALQKKFEPKQAELQNANKEIEDLKKQLNAQEGKLNDDARASLTRSIDTKQKALQRNLEDAQSDFQAQQSEVANRIGGKLMDVLDKYAKENGYGVILDVSGQQSAVLWAGASADVTKAVVDAYNAQFNVPAPAKPAAAAPGTSKAPAAAAKPLPAAPSATNKP